MKFTKMQGCGNDYIYVDCTDPANSSVEESAEIISIRVSDRHFGIGSDGLVLILPSKTADAKMRIFNADGSEAKMCGNATRCIGRYLYERKGLKKDTLTLETASGIKTIQIKAENGKVSCIRVNMGAAITEPEKIPVNTEGSPFGAEVVINGVKYLINAVSMGNPHCVLFSSENRLPEEIFDYSKDLAPYGTPFEHHPMFPEGVNTEFVRKLGENTLEMRVWERGSGETLACGTGACAVASAACIRGICDIGRPVKVKLRGGELEILYTPEAVFMSGGAEFVCDGSIDL